MMDQLKNDLSLKSIENKASEKEEVENENASIIFDEDEEQPSSTNKAPKNKKLYNKVINEDEDDDDAGLQTDQEDELFAADD